MGRRERPLDPAEGPVPRFAGELRKLRQDAGGLTYRAMAARVHYSAATLAQAAAGDRLPSLPVALAYVQACGGDPEEWRERWQEAAREASEQAAALDDGGEAPYLGLTRFEPGDRDRFFGRDALVERLAELVRDHLFVLLTGPSGSGKSSLLRAGLIPRLRAAGGTAIRVLSPGPHPLRTHAGLLRAGDGGDRVVIADQFEEVFTLCADPAERAGFIDALLTAGRARPGSRVVIAVRADFLRHFARYPDLTGVVRDTTLLTGPMSPAELREAIVKPAAARGLTVERTLTARLVHDVADEPGGLPLMSHVLLETWRRRHGRALTLHAYESAGGLHGAIARTAEDLYDDLPPPLRQVMRRLLLRMVNPGQGAQDTRRPVPRPELLTGEGEDDAERVLERLVRARLVTIHEDTAELAHEALLTAWPRLQSWIEEDREALRELRRLSEAAASWHELRRDPGALYRGVRLSTAQEQFASPARQADLSPLEREFLAAGLRVRDRDRRRRGLRTVGTSALLVCTLMAALVAWQQNQANDAQRRETEARRLAGVAESLRASDPVTAMRLSLAARHVADLPETRSALLGAMAQKAQDSFTVPDAGPDAMTGLSADGTTLISIGAGQVTSWDLDTHARTLTRPGLGAALLDAGVRRGDAGKVPLFEKGGKITLWDLATGVRGTDVLGTAPAGFEAGTSGRSVAGYGMTGSAYRVRLWSTDDRRLLLDVRTPRKPRPAGITRWPWASGSASLRYDRDKRAYTDPELPDATASPDDRLLALCVPGAALQIWDVAAGRRISTPWAPDVTTEQCINERVRFTPDGRHVAVISPTQVRFWDVRSGKKTATVEYPRLRDLAFSADGRFVVATDGADILLWRVSHPESPVFWAPLAGETASDLRIDPAAGWIRYLAGPDGDWGATVRTLRLGPVTTAEWQDQAAGSAAFSPGGATLVTAYAKGATRVRFRVRDTRAGHSDDLDASCRPSTEPMFHTCEALMAFSSDGRSLVYGAGESHVQSLPQRLSIWDVTRRRQTDAVVVPGDGDRAMSAVAFGPGDTSLLLVAMPVAGSTRVWDLRTRTVTSTIPDTPAGEVVLRPGGDLLVNSEGQVVSLSTGRSGPGPGKTSALAFSGDGTRLAAGDLSGSTVLWDGAVRRRLGVLATDKGSISHLTPLRFVSALAFSPDGRTLAVGDYTGLLHLWDTESSTPIGLPLPTPGDAVLALAFGRDGRTLYSAGRHTGLRTFDLGPDAAEAAVCARAGGGLSPEQWRTYVPQLPYRALCRTGES
ncbi:helix-turn-helix domain-containing protein [Nonomuraea zeae]|uniref:Helix-turn-helix domain-containing protein n=1 Tax=Nonomuraea zeae TaxID=1642303 RepID=A0A5S4G4Z7_9ACTN|nr:helix-turn-helix domain-containing protein [Nonomuraea zeae]TMR28019.1 helix-turn-helix domain-containing protein [Nonomuraea zeae]